MLKSVMLRLVTLLSFSGLCVPVFAQAFEKNHYHHNEWTKGRFAEVVTVKNPGTWVFLAGVGAEAEKDGAISQLARPGMLVEMDVIAVTAK